MPEGFFDENIWQMKISQGIYSGKEESKPGVVVAGGDDRSRHPVKSGSSEGRDQTPDMSVITTDRGASTPTGHINPRFTGMGRGAQRTPLIFRPTTT